MAQLLERFAFDLPDALASDPEEVADLFERMLLAAPVEAERWMAVREAVVEMISAQRGELSGKVEETKKLVEILSQARERESEYRAQTGQRAPEPQFTLKELERVADNAAMLRSAAILKQFNAFERRFNSYADPKERISPDEQLARAHGREVTAKVFLHESAKSQADFRATRQVQPLQVEIDGRLSTHRFIDTQPQSFLEKIIRDRAGEEGRSAAARRTDFWSRPESVERVFRIIE